MPKNGDIVISKELLVMFNNNVRILEKHPTGGMWPVDISHIKRLQKVLPQLVEQEALQKQYELAIAHKGKSLKADALKSGIAFDAQRIVNKVQLIGIPVPWTLLKKAGIDHKAFDVVLVPKK